MNPLDCASPQLPLHLSPPDADRTLSRKRRYSDDAESGQVHEKQARSCARRLVFSTQADDAVMSAAGPECLTNQEWMTLRTQARYLMALVSDAFRLPSREAITILNTFLENCRSTLSVCESEPEQKTPFQLAGTTLRISPILFEKANDGPEVLRQQIAAAVTACLLAILACAHAKQLTYVPDFDRLSHDAWACLLRSKEQVMSALERTGYLPVPDEFHPLSLLGAC